MKRPDKTFILKRIAFVLFCAGLIALLPLADSILHSASSANVTRGPYLQSASQTGITIVWNTDQAFACKLRYGRILNQLDREVVPSPGVIHAAVLTNLQPDTQYFYEIEVDGTVVMTGDDYWFRTYPPVASTRPFTFLAWGDSGTSDPTQSAVANQMDTLSPRPEFALGIGDLVYPAGEPQNYNPAFFKPYRNLIRNMVIWPAMGNHDALTGAGQPYLDAFYCPTNSGAAANPSNTELYYSFDYGQAHFVCLDSHVTYNAGTAARNTMLQWLTDDLDAANTQGARWKFVYFHHPPYSKGTHDSDVENQLIWMRNNLNPIMEARGVDMVLTGHSHVYERSFLLKGNAVLQANAADYTKIATPDGCIYIVTGCGGRTGSGTLNHPLMAFSKGNIAGNSVIDVSADVCRGYFVQSDGQRIDLFSLSKATDTVRPFVRSASSDERDVEIVFNEPLETGIGANGAENIANYSISGGVTMLGAVLQADQRTVRLATSVQSPGTAYTLTINNLRDVAAAPNTITANSKVAFVHHAAPGIKQGANWRYFEGTAAPPVNWMDASFRDDTWLLGAAGFGYGDSDDATVLNMQGNYRTLYVRRNFNLPSASSVTGLRLKLRYDDGFVAFLNGVEIARNLVPAGQDHNTDASGSHEASNFETFDLSGFLGNLVNGENLLAIEGHNVDLSTSTDFSLDPYLEVDVPAQTNVRPVAVLWNDVSTINPGATVSFSAAQSFDPDGTLTNHEWIFGDGSASGNGLSTTHTYGTAGVYRATLTVTDNVGDQSVASVLIYVQGVGNLPVASAGASAPAISPGGSVTFNSVGSNDPDGGSVWTHWDFDDPGSGNANHSNLGSPVHTFATTGQYKVVLTVTDDEGSQATANLTITVGSPPATPTIPTLALPDAPLGSPYTFAITASGGDKPYAWSRISGTLPDGINFGSNGKFSGTATTLGASTFTIEVQDTSANPDTRTYTLNVVQPPQSPSDSGGDEGCSTGTNTGSTFLWAMIVALTGLCIRWIRRRRSSC